MKWYKELSRQRSVNQNKNLTKPKSGFNAKTDINSDDDDKNSDKKSFKCHQQNFKDNCNSLMCIKRKVARAKNGMKTDNKPGNSSAEKNKNVNYNLVQKLEQLISDSDEHSSSSSNSSHISDRDIVDPEDFFEDPEEVTLHKALLEWDIVDVISETTNEELDDSFVRIPKIPSVISLRSYEEDTFGLYHTCECNYLNILEAYYPQFFDYDIQFGKIWDLASLEHEEKDHQILDEKKTFEKGRQFYCQGFETEVFARSLMGPLLGKNNFTPIFKLSLDTELSMFPDKSNVKKYFGLTDAGNIIIHLDHITVAKGETVFVKKCHRKLWQGINVADEMHESTKFKHNWREIIQKIFNFMREKLAGHPRNKTVAGGPGESVGAYALSLANDQTSTFSRNIENFISCTKESKEAAPQVVMRNMRQFMSGMKNYLVKHGEGDFSREVQKACSRLKPDEFLNLDTILEGVMHRLVILPLREHLYGLFVDYYTRSSDIQLLVENVKYAASRSPADFGIRSSVTPPTPNALRQISAILVRLQETELPLEKLDLLLAAVSTIFEATGCPKGQQLSADDFLPLLVFVVARCGFIGAEIEAEFMWGLLQPSLLSGEAGYYLTALCSAVHVLKSFMASDNEGTGSLDWRSSSLPACSSVLRVIIPDECNGSIQTRTLPVRPHTTTKEVCRIIAHKARITNSQDYALFKLVDGEETLLQDNECPQDVRMAARGKHCSLAYKRIEAKIAWPTDPTDNLLCVQRSIGPAFNV